MTNFLSVSIALIFVISLTEANTRVPNPNGYQKNAGTHIIGGRPAKQGETPYQLALRIYEYHYCGATLVEVNGMQLGICAAHCILQGLIPDYYVVAGDLNIADNTGIEQRLSIQKIVKHQNYSNLQNDIALLFFNGSFILNENVQPVSLPTQGQETFEGNLTVSGWGTLQYEGSGPDELQIVEIPVIDDEACQKMYEDYVIQVTDDMICTAAPEGDLNPCHGDSGGPAVANFSKIANASYLAGIVSFAKDCGYMNGYPSVYTKVSHYIEFIEKEVANYKNSL